jgi:hypothetical protein
MTIHVSKKRKQETFGYQLLPLNMLRPCQCDFPKCLPVFFRVMHGGRRRIPLQHGQWLSAAGHHLAPVLACPSAGEMTKYALPCWVRALDE